ncbi:MAG: universal stress protein [Pseudomonadota bacterium]
MAYKTVLTYVPSPEHVTRLFPVAEHVARSQDAHVVGLHAMPAIRMYSGAEVPIPAEIYERQREVFRTQAQATETAFKDAAGKSGLRYDWRCKDQFEPDVARVLVENACTSDLTVMEQDAPDPLDLGWDLASTVVIDSGRPVLLTPRDYKAAEFGKRVIVGWNGSREAARAAFDALPLLQAADAVVILSVNPSSDDALGRFAPGGALATALDRHGVKAEVQTVSSRSGSGELLTQVEAHKADLLVMGCYGHSRLREAVIGGATRNVLNEMSVPVLMSH